ncbi:hypothetical protein M0208_03735 [Sphingomonas sp. SUN019]|uniref:hypothetical protein n=1 Tax=Sphingomonas sp. SUN019 TaxID=2937788 RepID=UPI00216403B5|nr:hypothetical protein [Sphingomonas sp. SUN019]UVO49663.1 hypothetical protein M0208_03735 [Sphingomonas sp. SUN019]
MGLPGLPKWSLTAGGDALPMAGLGGDVLLHADAIAKTRHFGDPTGSRFTTITGYALANCRIGFRSAQGWEQAVLARNLFDRDYIQNLTIRRAIPG